MLNSDEDLISNKTITTFINANSTLNSDIILVEEFLRVVRSKI